MPASPGAITPEDRPTVSRERAANHRGGPLLVLGGAGSGRTQTLIDRFAGLVAGGTAPEEILLLTRTAAAAEALRARVEDALGDRPFEELPVLPIHGMCARLLRDEALEAGIDPFAVTASPADRLALLLDRVDELTAAPPRPARPAGGGARRGHHADRRAQGGRDPAAALQRVGGVAAGTTASGASASASSPGSSRPTTGCCSSRGCWTSASSCCAPRSCWSSGRMSARASRAAGAMCWSMTWRTRRRPRSRVISLLAAEHGDLVATADDDQAIDEPRGAADRLRALLETPIGGRRIEVVRLPRSLRCPERVVVAAEAVVAPIADRLERGPARRAASRPIPGGADPRATSGCGAARASARRPRAWRRRSSGWSREGVAPGRIGVLVRSVRSEGQELAVALEERALPFRLAGAAAFFGQAEVRDVLAWLRLLVNPSDAGAVVRALARPPIELHSVDLARCIQIAKRRKLDMVSGAGRRDRVARSCRRRRASASWRSSSSTAPRPPSLDTTRPDLFVHRLIERLGLRRAQVFAAQADVVERLVSLAHVGELAASYVRRAPQATPREFARWLAAVAEAGGIGDAEDEDGTPPRDDAVAVLPMHAAKGLEFDHVFVCGLQSSRMPGARRVAARADPRGAAGGADAPALRTPARSTSRRCGACCTSG